MCALSSGSSVTVSALSHHVSLAPKHDAQHLEDIKILVEWMANQAPCKSICPDVASTPLRISPDFVLQPPPLLCSCSLLWTLPLGFLQSSLPKFSGFLTFFSCLLQEMVFSASRDWPGQISDFEFHFFAIQSPANTSNSCPHSLRVPEEKVVSESSL